MESPVLLGELIVMVLVDDRWNKQRAVRANFRKDWFLVRYPIGDIDSFMLYKIVRDRRIDDSSMFAVHYNYELKHLAVIGLAAAPT